MENGLGHGVWIVELDDVERIDGRRKILVALDDVVLGSLTIGLKNFNSVLMLSGEDE